jgi:hypothetical protein
VGSSPSAGTTNCMITDERKQYIKNQVTQIIAKKNELLRTLKEDIMQRVQALEKRKITALEDLVTAGSADGTSDLEMAMYARRLVAVLAEETALQERLKAEHEEFELAEKKKTFEELTEKHREFFDSLSTEENLYAIHAYTKINSFQSTVERISEAFGELEGFGGMNIKMIDPNTKNILAQLNTDDSDDSDEEDGPDKIKISID